MEKTFGSTCHGAGRVMSRSQAKKKLSGKEIAADLLKGVSSSVLRMKMPLPMKHRKYTSPARRS
jgi:RNA-splicing ligase RtcB